AICQSADYCQCFSDLHSQDLRAQWYGCGREESVMDEHCDCDNAQNGTRRLHCCAYGLAGFLADHAVGLHCDRAAAGDRLSCGVLDRIFALAMEVPARSSCGLADCAAANCAGILCTHRIGTTLATWPMVAIHDWAHPCFHL